MTTEELARLFNARRYGSGKYRARCPAHKGKSLTMALYAGEEKSFVYCFYGCTADDILATVGLKWQDTLYRQKDTKEWKAAQKARREQEAFEYRGRIRNLIVLFKNEGYRTLERDKSVAIATAELLAIQGDKPHLQKLLSVHMERIIASQFL